MSRCSCPRLNSSKQTARQKSFLRARARDDRRGSSCYRFVIEPHTQKVPMLITFTSKAAAEVMMYQEHAKRILDLLHKDAKRGVFTAAELPLAVSTLEKEI